MQEVEIENTYDKNFLGIPGLNLELEMNCVKSRAGIYVSEKINYNRMKTLEGKDSHLVIIDIKGNSDIE